MFALLRALLLSTAALVLIAPAQAAETAPADTANFVGYCADHFEVCRKEVLDVSNINMMQMLGGNHGCSFPHTPAKIRADSIAATKAILVWLNANDKTWKPKTFDAIEQAMKTLWPKECH